ncbi:RecQ family ATP-dependent DNA helicase [Jannaschia seohaensis]|uniref:DNA 3'-5' helicase n=1 Tax=Jannaschia seohaensis TaxID=475081 RepID=A0A2Y9ACS0_9RHOB|nr:RecQ family ATP-dependent DNA helicase [Jannaschia seohaensis]PWJ21399.1 ATP-dependent DNA helicase RecQ [Jannaschia seohaensis]SSA42005.1 ATP-dependent DNA helicase RecQ [Jannaschia seohaensis]
MRMDGIEHDRTGEMGLLDRCISVDLEVDPSTARVFALAAVGAGEGPALISRPGRLDEALDRLEAQVAGAAHLIGHNVLRHDLAYLAAARPRLHGLADAPIDTLWLNPLAFPRNPYHRLVKHYQDGRLLSGAVNDPERDARLVFEVLQSQMGALRAMGDADRDAVAAYHVLCTLGDRAGGFDAVFREARNAERPSLKAAEAAIRRLLEGRACLHAVDEVVAGIEDAARGWPLAYALSWIGVAGGDSVMPPWVRMQFPEAARLVRELRDTACGDPACAWCRETADPVAALTRWFGFPAFRPEPVGEDGRPLQERIVDDGLKGRSLLGILPTGTGKSVCYQIPALAKFDRIGALTVVISPLVALMADQVAGMERAGITSAVTVNGMLSMPERQEALDRVRLGEAAMLIISPEQLRSVSVRSVLKQREVGLWVLDEAHCVSKWGHDFRPDYRYVGRFIREFSGDEAPAPVICLTATAKPDVIRDIRDHFRNRLGVELALRDGGASRTNLSFDVRETGKATKLSDILDAIEAGLPAEGASGAVVYCSTRGDTERVAAFLVERGMAAAHFHAGMTPDDKARVQEAFRVGELRVIAATNAFGMGVDKPDVRLVVHADIPGSLENYLQEAGRAGRDRDPANCVLLYARDDVERQFSLTARSRLARHEIGAILRALRGIDDRTRRSGTVVATPGEILRAEMERAFVRDDATDDTRVKTAVSWLEEAKLVSREENRVQVFPSSLLVRSVEEAERSLSAAGLTQTRHKALLGIIRHLMNAPADLGVSTDELSGASGLSHAKLSKAMSDLETLGLARNDMTMTAFVHLGTKDASTVRLAAASDLETALLSVMREAAPDADAEGLPLHLAEACQRLRDDGHSSARPDVIEKLLRGMVRDGRDEDGGTGNLRLRKASRNVLGIHLLRSWDVLERTAELRRQAAERLLAHLTGKLDQGARGKDLQVETTVGDMLAALNGDALLRASGVRDMGKLMGRTLLWLHEQGVVTLGKGLTVFHPAITVNVNPETRRQGFTQENFRPLEEHYEEQTIQTHVMAAYAERGLAGMAEAERLSTDYFAMDRDAFLRRWLPGRGPELRRRTTSASYRRIVEDLGNRTQQEIVADDREQTSVLVLAGPGSGKTRVLVHRIAYLLRVRREDPRGILVLSYNRHAAAEIRARLRHLVGDDARGVTVSTCHALAMRLVGASFAGEGATPDFDRVVLDAVRMLEGEGLGRAEAEAQRDALIQGYRWILVDEYQDVGPEEYALIAAVAGRSLEDPDRKLSLFAVGDDDQNIYAFAGASVDYIRRFEADYRARPSFLVENYRSTGAIVAASNAVIARAPDRMKATHAITVNAARAEDPPGGAMAEADPVGKGRVQRLDCPPDVAAHAAAAVDELMRLSRLDPDFRWDRCAVIAREWKRLAPVRSYAETLGIKVEMAGEEMPPVWRLREAQLLIDGLRKDRSAMLTVQDLLQLLNAQASNRWTELLAEGIADLARELGRAAMPAPDVVEWLAEWSRDTRGEQRGLLLTTAHRAKGLQFDHVVVLDGGWYKTSRGEDAEAPRRLFYVAMTRARRTLTATATGEHRFLDGVDGLLARPAAIDRARQATLAQTYEMPTLRSVDLGYAGRQRDGHPIHDAVAQARVGDALQLERRDRNWVILDQTGRVLGRMARAWFPPPGSRIVRATVGAVIRWRRVDSDPKFHPTFRRDVWETVLPEITFAAEVGLAQQERAARIE